MIKFVSMMITLWVTSASAQSDGPSTLLIQDRPGMTDSSVLDSGRFTVRPSTTMPRKSSETSTKAKRPINSDESETPAEVVHKPVETVTSAQAAPTQPPAVASTVQPLASPQPAQTAAPPPIAAPTGAPAAAATPPPESPRAGSVEDILLGGTPEQLEAARAGLHPEDLRRNTVELGLGTGYLYNDSHADYYYRNYTTSSPILDVSLGVWVTPFFGLNVDYMSSMGAAIKDDPDDSTSTAAVTHQWTRYGLRFRRFFGETRKAPSLTLGVDFREYVLTVPSEDKNRQGLRTTGAVVLVETQLPESNHYAWTLDFELAPNQMHSENQTGFSAKTGTSVKADSVGATLGGIFRFSRSAQVYWKLSHTIERDVFSGDAGAVDPITNTTPKGVSVTNSFTLLRFGYTWGN